MKKVIKKNDIKTITKIFNLNEYQVECLVDFADDINKTDALQEKTHEMQVAWELQSNLLYGTSNSEKAEVVRALLLYYGKKAQKETGWKLRETAYALDHLLHIGGWQVMKWFRGMHARGDKRIFFCETYGQNHLEIEIEVA